MRNERGKEFLEKLNLAGVVTNSNDLKIIASEIDFDLEGVTNEFKVLIVEDHAQIIDSYELMFEEVSDSFPKYGFTLDIARSCQEAIFKLKTEIRFDIILLDTRLSPYPEGNIYSGEDIGLWIKKNLSVKPKIIINTFSTDDYRLYNLYKNIDPDGFITKEEANKRILLEAIIGVIQHPPYYSQNVLNMIRRNFPKNSLLNDLDRRILYELSLGATMKSMEEDLPASRTTIEKRKTKMFLVMNIPDKNLKSLILEAKRIGFI